MKLQTLLNHISPVKFPNQRLFTLCRHNCSSVLKLEMILTFYLSSSLPAHPFTSSHDYKPQNIPAHILKQNTLGPCPRPSHVLTEFPSSIFLISMGYDAKINHRISWIGRDQHRSESNSWPCTRQPQESYHVLENIYALYHYFYFLK